MTLLHFLILRFTELLIRFETEANQFRLYTGFA